MKTAYAQVGKCVVGKAERLTTLRWTLVSDFGVRRMDEEER